MNKVVAVIVTYNRLEILKKCIDSLKMQDVSCDILVVDNASNDGTGQWLAGSEGLMYINTGKNIGGAGGFNLGIKEAVRRGYEYIWLMDDDCLPLKDALHSLMDASDRLSGNYGWLSSIALWTDGKECRMNRQKLKKSYYDYSHLMKYSIVQAEQATFVSLFLKSSTVRQVGLPIKEFFIWGDDIEYTRRTSVIYNMPCFVVGSSQVIHAMKENNGSSIANDYIERINRYSYAFRNENYLYRKEGFRGFCYYVAKCTLNFCRIIAYAPGKRLKRIGVLLSSTFKGFFFNPKIEYISEGEN